MSRDNTPIDRREANRMYITMRNYNKLLEALRAGIPVRRAPIINDSEAIDPVWVRSCTNPGEMYEVMLHLTWTGLDFATCDCKAGQDKEHQVIEFHMGAPEPLPCKHVLAARFMVRMSDWTRTELLARDAILATAYAQGITADRLHTEALLAETTAIVARANSSATRWAAEVEDLGTGDGPPIITYETADEAEHMGDPEAAAEMRAFQAATLHDLLCNCAECQPGEQPPAEQAEA